MRKANLGNYGSGNNTTAVIYNEVDDDDKDEYRFRLLDDHGKVLLSSSKKYDTRRQGSTALKETIKLLVESLNYVQIKQSSNGSWYFNIKDTTGKLIARRMAYFGSEQLCLEEAQRIRDILINE